MKQANLSKKKKIELVMHLVAVFQVAYALSLHGDTGQVS
jgi:hypothetical protein